MANRIPLIVANGTTQEIPAADALQVPAFAIGGISRVPEVLTSSLSSTDPNGFVNPTTDWTLSYTSGTRTVSIAPSGASAQLWSSGTLFSYTSSQTVVHPDTEGLHYFYFDETGTLQTTTIFTSDFILRYCFVAMGYWDATNNLMVPNNQLQNEMHTSLITSADHLIRHSTIGALYNKPEGGLVASTTLGDGSALSGISVQYTAGSFYDEDIKHSISAVIVGDSAVKMYRSGANGDWRYSASGEQIVRSGANSRANWNEWTGSTWQETELTDGYCMLMYAYAFNTSTPCIAYVMGQKQYATVEDAQLDAQRKPDLGTLPTNEALLLYAFIVQSSSTYTYSSKSRIVATHTGAVGYDWRSGTPPTGPGLPDLGDLTKASRQKPFFFTDFLGAASLGTVEPTIPIDLVAVSGGTIIKAAAEAHHPGIVNFRCNTTANGGIYAATMQEIVLSGGEYAEFIFKHAVANGTNTTVRMGFHDATSSTDAANGCYLEVPTNSLTMTGKTASASTRSSTSSSYVLTVNTWYRATVSLNADKTKVTYCVYDMTGTLLWTNTLTTNIPTGALRFSIIATNAGTSAIVLISLDWMAYGYVEGSLIR